MAGAAAPARAQDCTTHARMVTLLEERYGERPVALGLARKGVAVIEVFASRDGATWTIVATNPEGQACMLAAGEQWQIIPALVGRVM